MANPKLSEALISLLPGEKNKRTRQAILLAATAGKSEARTVKAEIAQENRLKTGVLSVGTIVFPTTISSTLDLFAWVIDFAIFQPGPVTKAVLAPHPTFARPDIFTGNALGQITYYAGSVDTEGNAQFPNIPTGEVLLRTVIRQPNGTNDVDDSIPSTSEWVSKSATGIQYLASNLALAPLAGTLPNVLTAGPNGELYRTNPALAGVFSTLEGIGGYSKILTITMDTVNQVNYYAVIGFNGISPNFEKGFLWVQFEVDGFGDIINNALKTFGEFDTSLFTLVKTAADTYELYVAHNNVNSFYSFRPEAQFGSSFRYLFHNIEAKVDPLPAGDQYSFSKYSDNPLTANELAAIQSADSPSALNAFVTVSALNNQTTIHNKTTLKQGGDGTNFYHLGKGEYENLKAVKKKLLWKSISHANELIRTGRSLTKNTDTGRIAALTYTKFGVDPVRFYVSYSDDDGLTWTEASVLPITNGDGYYSNIAYGNGIYHVAGGTNHGAISSDLVNWTVITRPIQYNIGGDGQIYLADVDAWFSHYIAWGQANSTARTHSSFDGALTWSVGNSIYSGPSIRAYYAYNGAGILVCALGGMYSEAYPFARSTDSGLTWTQIAKPSTGICLGILFDGTRFIAITLDKVYISTDGLTWTTQSFPALPISSKTDFLYNGVDYVIVNSNYGTGQGSVSYFSQNLIDWVQVPTAPTTTVWQEVILGNERFIAISTYHSTIKTFMVSEYVMDINHSQLNLDDGKNPHGTRYEDLLGTAPASGRNVDGGSASTIYLPSQNINGGGA